MAGEVGAVRGVRAARLLRAARTLRAGRSGSGSRTVRAPRRRSGWFRRHVTPSQPALLLLFSVLVLVLTLLAQQFARVPLSALVPVLMLGGFFLRLRTLLVLVLVVFAALAFLVDRRDGAVGGSVGSVLAVLGATVVLVLLYARSRERLGVQGTLGESMLVDLRDRLRAQGAVPPLPRGWQLEMVLRSAYGDSFSGDFVVATRSEDERWLEVVLVDVSGKGQRAGTRALLLSGAFGGLLGALPREGFLPAANRYLLRQDWEEGFATAVHLAVDLSTGDWRLSGAGHPPPMRYFAGAGRWALLDEDQGPALGLLGDTDFPAQVGRLSRGDALLLYTDGLVETPGRDLVLGIDRLMGQADRIVLHGFGGGAARVVDGTRTGEGDDRALVLLWRE